MKTNEKLKNRVLYFGWSYFFFAVEFHIFWEMLKKTCELQMLVWMKNFKKMGLLGFDLSEETDFSLDLTFHSGLMSYFAGF